MPIGYPVSNEPGDPWDNSYFNNNTAPGTFLGYTPDSVPVYATNTHPTIYTTADGKLSSHEIKVMYKQGEKHPTVYFLEDEPANKKIMFHFATGMYVTQDGAKFPSMAAAKKYVQNMPKQQVFPKHDPKMNCYTTSDGMVWTSSSAALKHQNQLNAYAAQEDYYYTSPKYDDKYTTHWSGEIIPGDKTVPSGSISWDTVSAHQIIKDVKKAKTAFEKLNDNIKKHNEAHKKKKLVQPIKSTRKNAKGNILGSKREIEENDYEDHDDYLGEDENETHPAFLPIPVPFKNPDDPPKPVPTPLKLTDADRAYIEAQVKKYEQQTGKPFVDKKYIPASAKFLVTLKSGGFFYTTDIPTDHTGTTGKKTCKATDINGKKHSFWPGYTIEAVNVPEKILKNDSPGYMKLTWELKGTNIKVTQIDDAGNPISTVPEKYKIQNGVEAPAHLYAGEVACDALMNGFADTDPNGNGILDIWYANSEPKHIAMINGKALVKHKNHTELKEYYFLHGDQHQLQYVEPPTWITFAAWKKYGGAGFTSGDYDPHSYKYLPGGKLVVKVKFYHYKKLV